MRCIQVVNVRWFNATAWYGMYLSRLLQEGGHEVLVLGLPGTLSARKGEEWGLPMRLMNLNTTSPWGIAALYAKLKALVRDFRPDVVNCHRGESFFLWGLLKKELGGFRRPAAAEGQLRQPLAAQGGQRRGHHHQLAHDPPFPGRLRHAAVQAA